MKKILFLTSSALISNLFGLVIGHLSQKLLVTYCKNLDEALLIPDARPYQMIILDQPERLVTSKNNAWANFIQKSFFQKAKKVILSSRNHQGLPDELKTVHFDKHIVKPLAADELLQLLQKLQERSGKA